MHLNDCVHLPCIANIKRIKLNTIFIRYQKYLLLKNEQLIAIIVVLTTLRNNSGNCAHISYGRVTF